MHMYNAFLLRGKKILRAEFLEVQPNDKVFQGASF